MNLKKLIEGLPISYPKGGRDIEISGLCSHSKLVAPGNLFIVKKGSSDEGAKHIQEAVSSGAAAILTDFSDPFLKNVIQLTCPAPSSMEGILAAKYYGFPSRSLFTVGVTGTNGKTTTTYLIKHLFDALGIPCGLIGTIEYIIGGHHFEAERTTPDAITNQKLFKEMVKQGCRAAVMEVSSHGLEQGRVDQIEFDAAVFTNLSQDHLDYHHTMEAYAAAKAKLFSNLGEGKIAIANRDSSWFSEIIRKCPAPIFTYGFTPEADLMAHDIKLTPGSTGFKVTYQKECVSFSWDLIGRFNISNCLAAIAVCLFKRIALKDLPPLVRTFSTAPGRLEKVDNLANLDIYVDYAHKPDALEKVLNSLRETTKGKIIAVFGCGGNRDRGKRPLMGEIASRLADWTIITSDNPRGEDPSAICAEIIAGIQSSNWSVEIDRRSAIEKAIRMATSQDLILIAGKGHETYQIFSHQSIPFDDRKVAQEIANRVLLSC